jgi:hypothetical protein
MYLLQLIQKCKIDEIKEFELTNLEAGRDQKNITNATFKLFV